jgi:hypothetical protein
MQESKKFEIFQKIAKNAEESLEEALKSAEIYDMSEAKAVDTGLKNFFIKINQQIGAKQV